MKKLITILAVTLAFLVPIHAEDNDDEYEEGVIEFNDSVNLPGDQYIRVELGLNMPMNFPSMPSLFKGGEHQLSIGGIGVLGYHYFITDKFIIGGDLGFGFNVSIGNHVFSFAPILFTATYQPTYKKFEFPLTLGVGIAWESFNNNHYFPGIAIRPEAGVHYRITQSWSAGVDVSYLFMPQFNEIHGNGENLFGHFLNIGAVARYIF